MNQSLAFVILHYNTMKETTDCICSIEKNIDGDKYNIVVVDNASPNGSGIQLEERYKENKRVHVILNSENQGFAKGNNLGYQYVLQNLKSDFICIMNNDTLLEKRNFFEVIQKEYERSHFGVMGPKIILKDGRINGLYYRFPNLEYFENELRIFKRELWQMRHFLNYPIVAFKLCRNFAFRLLGIKKTSRHEGYHTHEQLDMRREDVILHSCCIVFSPEYRKRYSEAFDPKTFLYKEEELLFLRCKDCGLKTVYNPELEIRHLEDAATNSVRKNKRKRIIFWMENQIKSLEIVIEKMRKMEA